MSNDIVLLTEAEVLAFKDLQIVDVRERSEWDSGYIKGAMHIPLDKILKNANELMLLEHDKPVLVYCKRGVRSLNAALALKQFGFSKVFSLKDGIAQWHSELCISN